MELFSWGPSNCTERSNFKCPAKIRAWKFVPIESLHIIADSLTLSFCSLFSLFKAVSCLQSKYNTQHTLAVPLTCMPQCLSTKGRQHFSSSQVCWRIPQNTCEVLWCNVVLHVSTLRGLTGIRLSSWLTPSHTVLSPINSCVQSFEVSINVHSLSLALICLHQQQFLLMVKVRLLVSSSDN